MQVWEWQRPPPVSQSAAARTPRRQGVSFRRRSERRYTALTPDESSEDTKCRISSFESPCVMLPSKKKLRNFLNSTKKTTKKCLPSERRGGCTTWCIFGHAILRPFFCVGVLLTNWNLQSNNGNCSNMLVGQIFECIWNDAKLSDFLSGIFLLGLFVGVLLINMSTKWKTCSSGKILGVAEMMLNYPFGHVFLRLFVGPLIYQISCWWMKHRNMISDANEQSFERWNWR